MANPKKTESQFADNTGRPLISNAVTHVAAAKVDYTTGDLDAEAEVITALNTTNGKINSILAALEAHGLVKDA